MQIWYLNVPIQKRSWRVGQVRMQIGSLCEGVSISEWSLKMFLLLKEIRIGEALNPEPSLRRQGPLPLDSREARINRKAHPVTTP